MHSHSHGLSDSALGGLDRRATRWLVIAIVPLLVATVVGLVILRPTGGAPDVSDSLGIPTDLYNGTVTKVVDEECNAGGEVAANSAIQCARVVVRLTNGPDEDRLVTLDWTGGGGSPVLEQGDRIVLGHVTDLPADAPADADYYFADFQRRSPMIWLAVLFAIAVVALGRLRGLRALVALGISLLVLVKFVLPSILEGHSPVLVAVVGSSAILVAALFLSHGLNVRTATAVLGTLVSLGITGVLAVAFVGATQLTGLASEEAGYLQAMASQINLEGLILGGIIIGSLGVLDDVTVTQASAVWELHQANPTMGFGGLYRSALRIGRDHIASTVNTLVLAYAGASLPLLILFTQSHVRLGNVLTGEVVAVEIVRTLVGSIGLVAAVPVTTALTALVITADHAEHAESFTTEGTGNSTDRADDGAPGDPGQRATAPELPDAP
jgi:uncharacterized membrane protein